MMLTLMVFVLLVIAYVVLSVVTTGANALQHDYERLVLNLTVIPFFILLYLTVTHAWKTGAWEWIVISFLFLPSMFVYLFRYYEE
jgi:hypothetical protein